MAQASTLEILCMNGVFMQSHVVVDAETDESALVITGIKGRINRAVWGPLNRTIITAGEDATIRIWDSEVSVACCYRRAHITDGRYIIIWVSSPKNAPINCLLVWASGGDTI
jgi:WD40 repeat protein